MRDTIAFYLVLALSVAAEITSILTLNPVAIAFTSSMLVSSVIILKLWYVIEASIFKHTNLIQVFGRFELSGDRISAIRRASGKISATTAVVLHVGGKAEVDKKKIENVISHISYPFKFMMQAERLDLEKLLDKLQTRRKMREIALSRVDHSSAKNLPLINSIKREIEVLEHDIESISSGDVPLKVSYYIMTTGVSDSVFSAEESAKAQIRELASQFDAILASKSEQVRGSDLIGLLELDSSMVLS